MNGMVRVASADMLALASILAMVFSVGCGGSSYEGPERAGVSGTVTLDGKPLPYGSILFLGQGSNRMASAVIQDGSYSITEENGPNLGEYAVQITGYAEAPAAADGEAEGDDKADPDSRPAGKQIVPAEYNTASKLKVAIASGKNTHDFKMTGAPK